MTAKRCSKLSRPEVSPEDVSKGRKSEIDTNI